MEHIKLSHGMGKSVITLMFKRPIFFVCKEYIQINRKKSSNSTGNLQRKGTG